MDRLPAIDDIDWGELPTLYRAAPFGDPSPDRLKTAFTNRRFRSLVREEGRLVAAGRAMADGVDCSNICDVAALPTGSSAASA